MDVAEHRQEIRSRARTLTLREQLWLLEALMENSTLRLTFPEATAEIDAKMAETQKFWQRIHLESDTLDIEGRGE
jgi:hypothetical protein